MSLNTGSESRSELRRQLKVAIVHNIISPYRTPFFSRLSRQPGIDLTVLYCDRSHKERRWNVVEPSLFSYKTMRGITVELGRPILHFNPQVIWRIIADRYDVVVLGGISDPTTLLAYLVGKIRGIPIVIWSEETNFGKWKNLAFTSMKKLLVRNASALVTPGIRSRRFHLALGADDRAIFIAPNAVDVRMDESSLNPTPDAVSPPQKKDQPKRVVLYIGQLVERKGVRHLIEAYRKLRVDMSDIALVLVGEGPQRKLLEEMCMASATEDVLFTGWVSDEVKYSYYQTSSVFVLPTLEDVWGLVVNEAMAFGLPIVCSSAAGASDDLVIDGRNGFIVPPNDPESIYNALRRILSSPALMKSMKKESVKIVNEKFNIQAMVQGFIDAIAFAVGDLESSGGQRDDHDRA